MNKAEAAQRVIFERLVCGEDQDALRAQLAEKVGLTEADDILMQASARLDKEGQNAGFAKTARKIRKRRLVGGRYWAWKVWQACA